jgi:hypothetical protein
MSVRTNLLSNPSGRRTVTGYTVLGSGTIGQSAGKDTYVSAGVTQGGGSFGIAIEATTVALKFVAGQTYTFSAWGASDTSTFGVAVQGAGVASGGVFVTAPSSALARVSTSFVAGSGAVNFYVLNGTSIAAGHYIYFYDAMVEVGATVGTYFDGTYPLAYWAGTADNSTSTQYVPVVTLTPYLDANPVPRALVAITDTPPAAQTVNLYRTAEGRTMEVRGGVNLYSVGGVTVMDFEAPFGVPATYQAEMFTTVGVSLGFTNPGTVTLAPTLPDTSYVWVHQPLNPSLAIQASMAVGTAADVIHQSPGSVIFAEGATVGVRIGGQRLGITGMQLTIVCTNPADADEFLSMFGGYTSDYPAVLCIRSVGPVRIPRVFFASVAETHEVTDYSQVSPFITFALTVDEARPPTPGLVLPSLRMKDIDFPYATMNAQDAAYATNLAQDSDYSLAGVAGP